MASSFVRKAYGSLSSLSLAALASGTGVSVYAQDDAAEVVEEVYVTGSLIKRSEADSALPIQFVSLEDIQATGVTTAAGLMEKMPVMQGFWTASDSVGGSGGGLQTASLRGLGSEYTLVLLNGHRMAPADSGSSIDLSNIPVSALERVEVLTDGASALYGSDAIAGVVNFILKKDFQGVEVGGRLDMPEESGGEKGNVYVTAGFGDFDADGFNVMVSLSHDRQEQLAAQDREFAETGIIYFHHPGFNQQALFFNGSLNAIPGNARVRYIDDDSGEEEELVFSPYQLRNGLCPTQTTEVDLECTFDYTSTIEILPESERTSAYSHLSFRISDNLEGFATALLSRRELTSRIAPYPTGYVRLFNSETDAELPGLVVDEVVPALARPEADGGFGLSATELDNITVVDGRWRALPAGNRTTEYKTDSYNISTGLLGNWDEIDYQVTLTHAYTNVDQNYPEGWLLSEEFIALVSSSELNIFAGQEELTDEDYANLAPTIYDGDWDEQKVKVTMLDANAGMPVFELSGGEAQLAFGMDYRHTKYVRELSEANREAIILFLSTDTPYDFSREQYGLFAELNMPFTSTWEVNASLRFDEIGGITDNLAGEEVNDSQSDTTYKISTLWAITDQLSFRGSFGTGFKSPTLRQVAGPLEEFGVTSGSFTCPFPEGDPLRSLCLSTTGEFQSQVYRLGNPDLKPETSEQWALGFVVQPNDDTTFSIDYWKLEMEDIVSQLQESQIYDNPETYRDLFTTWYNPGTGEDELAIIQGWVNVGTEEASGIDWSAETFFELGFGTLETSVRGTYMLESDSSLTGSSLGVFGADDEVVFRNIIRITNSLTIGDTVQNLAINYRSGYLDDLQTVTLIEPDGSFGDDVPTQLKVPSYTTVDYNLVWSLMDESLDLTFGVTNLTDNEPPLSLRVAGSGHQVGWDPRYTDAYGRTYYLGASFTF